MESLRRSPRACTKRVLTDFSPGVPPSSVSMLIVCIGLLKLAVLEMAATCPGLPLSPISIALPSDSALDSSDGARIFRRSFFRLSRTGMAAGTIGYGREFTAESVWKPPCGSGGRGVDVSCVSCVKEPPVPGEAELGEIGTGTAVTCGKLGSGGTIAVSV
uniref:Uncharacterized protein n=1 Tax=Anopheles culicifacies TaxID=139723 RepID=A0A182M212_9DIPT